jgi:hypothetical protein
MVLADFELLQPVSDIPVPNGVGMSFFIFHSRRSFPPRTSHCPGCDVGENNRFVISGRGGMPSAALSIGIMSPQIWHDLRSSLPQAAAPIAAPIQSASNLHSNLQEATNWQRNAQGQVELQVELQAPQAFPIQKIAQRCASASYFPV